MDLSADFLRFGTSVFFVGRRFRAVWSVGREECSVKCEVWSVKEAAGSEKCEVWSVKCEVWSVKFKFGVLRAQCEVWSVKFGVWRKQWEVRSVKCGLWSVKCEVWSVKFGVRRVQCEVWSVACEDFASSLAEKKAACRGKDTVGTGCLRTIGHLFLGNFRRRLARVYVPRSWYLHICCFNPTCLVAETLLHHL